jgi:hypothetical protein
LIAVENPEELLKPPVEVRKREERLVMELPPRAKSTSNEYELSVKWKRQRFYVLKCNMEKDSSRKSYLTEFENPRPRAILINLGEVNGHGYITSGDYPIFSKRVDYMLKIPGAYVLVTISAHHLFDESEWNPYLATLRIASWTQSMFQ